MAYMTRLDISINNSNAGRPCGYISHYLLRVGDDLLLGSPNAATFILPVASRTSKCISNLMGCTTASGRAASVSVENTRVPELIIHRHAHEG